MTNYLLIATKDFLKNANFTWAVCGGFALDLFLEKNIRLHGDIDICVFEKDREKILHYMLKNNWNVYEFCGQGKVRPLDITLSSETGRNLMCTYGDCDIVKFYPCDEKGLLWHEFFHIGIEKFNYLEFLFNSSYDDYFVFDKNKGIEREITKAILFNNDIPYLAPEIALLYKSSYSENKQHRYDFKQVYPQMNDEQKMWFIKSLNALYPGEHPWKS